MVDADPTSDVPQPPRAMPVTPMAPRMLSINILGLMVSLLGPDDKPPEVATGGLSRGLETGGDPPRPVVRPPPPSSPAPDRYCSATVDPMWVSLSGLRTSRIAATNPSSTSKAITRSTAPSTEMTAPTSPLMVAVRTSNWPS